MPSKSPAQARLMSAAAHTKGGYDAVPQSVGKEFNSADKGAKPDAMKPTRGSYSKPAWEHKVKGR